MLHRQVACGAASVLVGIGLLICPTPADAQTKKSEIGHEQASNSTDVMLGEIELTVQQQSYFAKIIQAGPLFGYDSEGNLILDADDDVLHRIGFSNTEITLLRDSLHKFGQIEKDSLRGNGANYGPAPMIHVDGGTLYISNADLKNGVAAGIATAAAIGPAALQAAFISLATMLGGPVGTTIGVILTILGAPGMAEMAGRIVWALGTGKDIYVKPVLSYPPYEIGYW